MMSGIGVAAIVFYFIGVSNMSPTSKKEGGKPWLFDTFSLPASTDVDVPLVVGAVMFGCGWGLMGACPAPAITNLGSRASGALPFAYIAFVIVGMTIATLLLDYKAKISINSSSTTKDSKVTNDYGSTTT